MTTSTDTAREFNLGPIDWDFPRRPPRGFGGCTWQEGSRLVTSGGECVGAIWIRKEHRRGALRVVSYAIDLEWLDEPIDIETPHDELADGRKLWAEARRELVAAFEARASQ